jgi:prepilin-type N-terminal cleavage/methylation domain-containing protein
MQKRAFSLVELSVVVVIVTVLVAGIFMGAGLVQNARLSNAKAHTAKSVVRDIQGLVAWYETSTKDSFSPGETYDSAQISEWRDIAPSSKIGLNNENVLLVSSPSANVIFVETGINSIPSIEFSGTVDSNSKLALSAFYQGSSAQKTIFMVFKPLGTLTSSETILDSISTGNDHSIAIKDTNEVTLNAGSSVSTATVTNPASFSTSSDYVMATYFDGSSSRVYLNDAENEVGGGNISPGSNELTGLTVGSDKDATADFNGQISEIIIFNRALKIQERKDIMSYLSTKYSISVSGL